MGKNLILISSGFIIPSNRLFSVVVKDSTYRDSVLGKRNGVGRDIVLANLIKDGMLSSSASCNDRYTNHIHNPSYDTFMTLVDTLAEIFGGISLQEFAKLQARNAYLSPLGFKFCLDLLGDKLITSYKEYLVAPSFFRITNPEDISPEEVNRRLNEIERVTKYNKNMSFLDILSVMMNDKGSIQAMFQYVLTDSNRGGMYG